MLAAKGGSRESEGHIEPNHQEAAAAAAVAAAAAAPVAAVPAAAAAAVVAAAAQVSPSFGSAPTTQSPT